MQIKLSLRSILIGAVVVLGVFLEIIKFWPTTTHELSVVEDNIFSSRPYAVSEKIIHDATKLITQHLPFAGPLPLPALSSLNLKDAMDKFSKNEEKRKQQEALKKAAAKGWHWVWNKTENKWVWKKTKKKTEDKKDDSSNTQVAAVDDTPPAAPSTPSASLPSIPLGPQSPAPAAANQETGGATGLNSNHFLSASEWEDYLEQSPSSTKTQSFVQQFKNHLVTDQVFYQVTAALLKNSNTTVQQQGVLALSLTPSVESFDQLATEQQSLQTSSPLYTNVNQDLNQYTQSSNLSILNQVLGQSSSTTADLTVGLNELQTAVKGGGTGGTGSTGPTTQGGASNFSSFVGTLTTLENNPNQSVASLAKTIAGEINTTGTNGGTVASASN